MQEIISWYMEHKTYGNILIIGIIGLMLYNKRNIEIEHELYNNFFDFV